MSDLASNVKLLPKDWRIAVVWLIIGAGAGYGAYTILDHFSSAAAHREAVQIWSDNLDKLQDITTKAARQAASEAVRDTFTDLAEKINELDKRETAHESVAASQHQEVERRLDTNERRLNHLEGRRDR